MDSVLFILSKILGLGLKVENWIILGLALCVWALFTNRLLLAKWCGTITLAAFVLIAIFPFGQLLAGPLEKPYPPYPELTRVDGIIILGGAEFITGTRDWGQTQLNHAADRLTEGAALALRFPEAKVLISGGSGRLRNTFDPSVGKHAGSRELMISLGVAPDRILWENRSRNTAENARLSLAMADPQPDEQWVLVTSAFHMRRSLSSFEAAGWPGVVPYPVDFRSGSIRGRIGWNPIDNIELLNTAIKEYVGHVAYRVMGR